MNSDNQKPENTSFSNWVGIFAHTFQSLVR